MKHKTVKVHSLYKITENKLERLRKICPKCGSFLAEHANRRYCGKCHYVEFKTQSS
ncbi:MAG: 30S ribosomal protein S27ae [Candidatus Aenigmatarchaeota archaeon]